MKLAELLEKLDKKHIVKLQNGEDHHMFGDDIKVTVYDQYDEEIYFSDCQNVETELEDDDFKKIIVFDFKFIDQYGYEDMKSKQAYEIYAIKNKEVTIRWRGMNGRYHVTTVNKPTYEEACKELDKKYNVAYFEEWCHGNKEDWIREYGFIKDI